MTQHRFFLPGLDLSGKNQISVEDENFCHQVSRVLRLKTGDTLIVLDNLGFQYDVQLFAIKPLVVLTVLKKYLNANEPSRKIVLYQSLIKKDKFEWVLQKGTEVGISEFVPVLAARSEKKEPGRPERLAAILKEAAEQSERGRIPVLSPARDFQNILAPSKTELNILLDPTADVPLARYFPAVPAYDRINILIGPEGGFTPDEIASARSGGWECVNLGPRILRTETAGVLAAGAILIATQS